VPRDDGAAICWGEAFKDGPVARTGPVQKVVAGLHIACFLQDGAVDCVSPTYEDHPYLELDVPAGTYLDFDSNVRTCGLRTDQEVVCWGAAGVTPPPADRPDFVRLVTHEGHVCGIDSEGAPTCWISTIGDDNLFVPSAPFLDFSLGGFHACGIRLDGEIECFIADYAADWNDEDLIRPYPEGPFNRIVLQPVAMACAIRPDGELVCWGRVYESGGLRDSEPKGLRYKDVSIGGGHVCAVTLEGELVCWGRNDFGQATPPSVDF
jgi:hypothetical protein